MFLSFGDIFIFGNTCILFSREDFKTFSFLKKFENR